MPFPDELTRSGFRHPWIVSLLTRQTCGSLPPLHVQAVAHPAWSREGLRLRARRHLNASRVGASRSSAREDAGLPSSSSPDGGVWTSPNRRTVSGGTRCILLLRVAAGHTIFRSARSARSSGCAPRWCVGRWMAEERNGRPVSVSVLPPPGRPAKTSVSTSPQRNPFRFAPVPLEGTGGYPSICPAVTLTPNSPDSLLRR